jgi:hypothetical protein
VFVARKILIDEYIQCVPSNGLCGNGSGSIASLSFFTQLWGKRNP